MKHDNFETGTLPPYLTPQKQQNLNS